jgi:signal transduction histidine kinase
MNLKVNINFLKVLTILWLGLFAFAPYFSLAFFEQNLDNAAVFNDESAVTFPHKLYDIEEFIAKKNQNIEENLPELLSGISNNLKKVTETTDSLLQAEYYYQIGLNYWALSNLYEAKGFFLQSIELFPKNDSKIRGAVPFSAAMVFNELDSIQKALDYLTQSIEHFSETNQFNEKTYAKTKLFEILFYSGDYQGVINQIKDTNEIPPFGLPIIAKAYHKIGSFAKANEVLANIPKQSFSRLELNCWFALWEKDYEKLAKQINKLDSLSLNKENIESLINLGEAVLVAEQFLIANKLFNKANENIHLANKLSAAKLYYLLYETYQGLNNLEKSFHFLEKHKEKNAEINVFNRQITAEIYRQQFNFKEQEVYATELRNQAALTEKNIQDAKRNTQLTLLFVALLLIGSIIFYKRQDKLKKTNEKIIIQTQQIEEQVNTKDKLISVLGHDLKTPINSLMGLVTLLENDLLDKDETAELIQNLKSKNLLVIDTLESLTRWGSLHIQKGQDLDNFKNINIDQKITQIISLYQPVSEAKNIITKLWVEPSFSFSLPENLFAFIIRNLYSNAIKFSHQNAEIHIKCNFEKEKNILHIKVKDFGVGMSQENMDKIFHSSTFFTKSGTNNKTGSGLGLKLVLEFSKKFNWDIQVKSIENEGTTFHIKIPIKVDSPNNAKN